MTDIAFSLWEIPEMVCFMYDQLRIVVRSDDKGIGNFNEQ